MSRRSFAHTCCAALVPLTLALAVACAGDEVLGPIDTAACTRGTLDVSKITEGAVTGRDCMLWSDRQSSMVAAESWTLRMKPNTGYVIRLLPVETSPGVYPFDGSITVYERNASGDANLVARGASYSTASLNEEAVMTTDVAREVAVRVEADALADTGSYRLEISTCPVRTLPRDSLVRGISTVGGCLSQGTILGAASRLTFLQLYAETTENVDVAYERSAGTGSLRARLGGPDLDLVGFLSSSYNDSTPPSANSFLFEPTFERIGRYTLTVRVHADSSATFDAIAGNVPSLLAPRHR